MNIYVLKPNQPNRRAGLTRAGYKGPRLLETINSSTKDAEQNMPPRAVKAGTTQVKKKVAVTEERNYLDEKNIFRPPESSSDDDEDDPRAADIRPTKFLRASEEPQAQATNGTVGTNSSKTRKSTVNGKGSNLTRNGKLSRTELSPNSGNVPSGPKRKIYEYGTKLGAGMVDPFGRIRVKKAKVKSAYGSDQFRYGSSPSIQPLKKNDQSEDRADSPKTSFQLPKFGSPLGIQDSDAAESPRQPAFKAVDTNFESPMPSGAEVGNLFRRPDKFEESPTSTPGSGRKFIRRSISISPRKEGDEKEPAFRNPELEVSQTDIDLRRQESPSPPRTRRSKKLVQSDGSAATQLPKFKKYDLGEELEKKVDSIIKDNGVVPPVSTALFDEETFSTTQPARCPMCKKIVDPDVLKAYGEMNTRQQGRFCRAHQKKTAKEDWTSNGYPEIDWDNLNSRIAKHYSFMEQLINGANSHYRQILNETVKAGKDRTLLKMTSNLTPGYYGSRGLQAISESIMHEFTPLLKKRSVKDRLMAARGVTGFVQSVLVPEVAVLLIMEDMEVEVEEARNILTESVGIGELVHEEIRDVVIRRVEDSEDDDEDGD